MNRTHGLYRTAWREESATARTAVYAVEQTANSRLLGVALVAVWRCFTKDAPEQPDNVVLYQFAGLLGALSGVYYFTK